MIEVHRLKGEPFYLNHRLIEVVERNPDTVVTLMSEKRYLVRESPEELIALIQQFEAKIFALRDSGPVDR